MLRNVGNKTEKLSEGAAQAQQMTVPRILILAQGANPCRLCRERAARPPGCRNASEHGSGGTCSERTESHGEGLGPSGAPGPPPLQPQPPPAASRLHGPGEGSEKRSESCHWASRFTRPLRVSTPHRPKATGCSTPGPAGDPARTLALWPSPLRRPAWPWRLTLPLGHNVPGQSGARPIAGRPVCCAGR